ncbi:hypothetical protein [Enterococcus dongliensis]|uniref:Uncharacterized protein n=1 Tax=Enterococcus dongliensis TaxID=2559925 RepID=A0ABU3ERJ0_9ENTE|nr:hypothetical protein [Enterococcus dongliensis]MDT2597473.1 hypothetical protein [Enterococcus dongliensis]
MENVVKKNENKIDYRASKYRSLINEIEFDIDVKEALKGQSSFECNVFSELSTLSLKFDYILSGNYMSLASLNDVLLNNIQYNCSHIYFEKITDNIESDNIEKGFQNITERFSVKNIPNDYHEFLVNTGYNILDRVTPSRINEIYFPVLKYDDLNIMIMSVVSFIDSNGITSNRACIVKINRENGNTDFHVNGKSGNFNIGNSNRAKITSPLSFFKYMRNLIGSSFSFTYYPKISTYKMEREKMFLFCNKMNQYLIGEQSMLLNAELSPVIIRQIRKIFKNMNEMNNNIKLDNETRDKIESKIFSTYLGEYITRGFSDGELKEAAKQKGCVCYPTKISFKGHELSRGKASARSKEFPLSFESVFYSLNTDIEIAGELDEFTLAWFDKSFFYENKDLSVSQTTIKIKKDYFSIVLLNTVHRNRKLVEFIEQTVRTAIS